MNTTVLDRSREPRIDLNADVGEGYDDTALMPFLTSCSIACGGHAGNDTTMRNTIRLALRHGVAIGAHPGFPDRARFGRSVTTRDPSVIEELVLAQTARLATIAASEGATLTHVKPHGALYNLCALDRAAAAAVSRAVAGREPRPALFVLASSIAHQVAIEHGLEAIAEGFADRGYLADASLAPRGTTGALLEDPERAAEQAVALVVRQRVTAVDGSTIPLTIDTLCLHGDTAGAARIAARVRARLAESGVTIAPPHRA